MKKLSIIVAVLALFACKKELPAESSLKQFKTMQVQKISCIECIYTYGVRKGLTVDAKDYCKQYCIYLENWQK